MNEIWKPIPGYEGLYEASTFGRVKRVPHYVKFSNGSIRFYPERIHIPQKATSGYFHVTLTKNRKRKTVLLNRVILMTFCGLRKGYDANHKDENPLNNRLDNLEWATRKENCNYGNRNKKISASKKGKDTAKCYERIGEKNPNSIKVYALNKDMTINAVYSCIREAGDAMGLSDFAMGRWANHKASTNEYRGLLWYTEKNLPSNIL